MRPGNKHVFSMTRKMRWSISMLVVVGILTLLVAADHHLSPQALAASTHRPNPSLAGDWPTYLYDQGHSGFNSTETIINPVTAPNLTLHWTATAAGLITTQAVVANGMIYWGSWDGLEHATNLDGTQAWATNLGTTTASCDPGITHGVLGTATVASVTIGGTLTPVVFVGGSNAQFYALNAATGAIIWHTQLGTPPDHEIWSSPAFYNGSIYIGIAHFFGSCPLIRGKVVQLNAVTGAIQHTFHVVPKGCLGGGVWGSVTVDANTNTLYFGTGDARLCSVPTPNAEAIVQLRASNLKFLSSWQVPTTEQIHDGDFGSTPTLFTATIGGTTHNLVGLANKNGIYYALDEANFSQGPVWETHVAIGGDNPRIGAGSISPSAWDGTNLYVAGGNTTIGGSSCLGGLRALDPATGAFIWERCMTDGPIIGATTAVPGVVAVGEGNTLRLVATSDGHDLFSASDTSSNSMYDAGPCISNGVLYIGNVDGNFYAYGM